MIGRVAWVVFNRARYIVRKHILGNAKPADEWFHDQGDKTRSVAYPLSSDSIVFEVGGYNGTWSSRIAALYDPNIYVFEPVESFFRKMKRRFGTNPIIRVFHFGLSDVDETCEICVTDDGSSIYRSSGPREIIQLRDIQGVVEELKISTIDLIQINIEGGEFRLLPRMLDAGVAQRCSNIQIQFHDVVPNAPARRQEIRTRLEATHSLLYDYPFVWECWRLKQ